MCKFLTFSIFRTSVSESEQKSLDIRQYNRIIQQFLAIQVIMTYYLSRSMTILSDLMLPVFALID